jgi:hypothetical protein
MFLKVLMLAAPVLGGGIWLAGGFDAADGGTSAAQAAAAQDYAEPGAPACGEVVDAAIERMDELLETRERVERGDRSEAAALEQQGREFVGEIQSDMKDAGCSEAERARLLREMLRRTP